MRYGLPALGFVWLGLAWHAVRIIGRRGLTEEAASYRRGYLFAAAGLVFVLATVHIWGSVAVFVMFYFGAGAWFYAGDAAPEPARPPERRPRRRRRGRRRRPPCLRGARPGPRDERQRDKDLTR